MHDFHSWDYNTVLLSNTKRYSNTSKPLKTNAVVTPLCKAASYEPRIAILGIWGDTWLTRGKYGIYVAVRGSYGALRGLRDAFCQPHLLSCLLRGSNEDTA